MRARPSLPLLGLAAIAAACRAAPAREIPAPPLTTRGLPADTVQVPEELDGPKGPGAREDFDLFGQRVVATADLDGDGVQDCVALVANAPAELLALSGATGAVLWHGRAADDVPASTLALAGDLDGDGVPEVAVGAPDWRGDGRPGRVLLFDGASGAALRSISAPRGERHFGYLLSASPAGGLLVAASSARHVEAGPGRVYRVSPGAREPELLLEGTRVSALCGLPEGAGFALGTAVWEGVGCGDRGHLEVFARDDRARRVADHRLASPVAEWIVPVQADDARRGGPAALAVGRWWSDRIELCRPTATGPCFAWEARRPLTGLVAAGDVDGDGLDDLLAVGDPVLEDMHPTLAFLSGADLHVLHALRWPDAFDAPSLDAAVPGDLNGDGAPDVVLGLSYWEIPRFAGRVLAVDGRSGAVLWSRGACD